MRKVVLTTIVAAVVCWSSAAWAQGLELIPFAGYRWGGGLSSLDGVRKFDTVDTYSFGGALSKMVRADASVEIYYGYFASDVDVDLVSGPSFSEEVARNDILLNGIWYSPGAYGPTKPYFSLGIGASIFSSEHTETVGRFAWSLGAGIRHDLNDGLAIRIDGRWMPVWVTTGTGVWCDPFYGCYGVGTGESYDQFELSLGLILKTGGGN